MENELKSKKLIMPVAYLWLLTFTIVYLLIFSLWTTPLYKGWYGCDASFFTMAGRGITKGWVPYIDFFDLKGPYFFFIEALGQFIREGRTGAFIVQCAALFASLVLIIKLLSRFGSKLSIGKRIFIVGIFLFFHIATLWGGNTLEEYMLPLNLLCLYMIVPAPGEAVISKIKPLTAFVFGVCFGIMLFAKVTVAAPIAGMVIAVILACESAKDFKRLFKFLLFAFLGILAAAAPIFIYFSYHHALKEMLYSVFIFAFKRSVDFGNTYDIKWELKISGCYFAIIFVLFQMFPKANREKLDDTVRFLLKLTFYMAFITAVLLHFGDPFIYYFTTVYPTLFTAFIAMFMIYKPFTLFKKVRLDVPVLCFLVTLCYFASWSASTLNVVLYDRDNGYYMNYVNQAEEMASLIPKEHRDDVYSFNIDMQWFEINKMLPCYSYTINLQFFVALDNRIEENIINKLNTDPPKWIVVGGDLSSYLPNINDVVLEKYVDIYDNDFASLYLLDDIIVKEDKPD